MKTIITPNSRPLRRALCTLLLGIAALWIMPIGARAQTPTPTPLSVTDVSLRRIDIGSNDLGFTQGDRIIISAQATPNGSAGTTATAQTTNLSTGLLYVSPNGLPSDPSTADPNYFQLSIPYDSNLTGPWTVTFTNDVTTANTTTVITPSIVGVMPAPFANSVTKSGSGLNPTFTWSFPTSVDGVTVEIWEKGIQVNPSTGEVVQCSGCSDQVFFQSLPGAMNSYTLPTSLAGGLTLTPGTNYVVDLRAAILFDPTGPVIDANIASDSDSYFDFTPTSAPLQTSVYLPTIGSNGFTTSA